jgi:hypothetical protein
MPSVALKRPCSCCCGLKICQWFAAELFVSRPKIWGFVQELREFLGFFNLLPKCHEGWVDPFYGLTPAARAPHSKRIAQDLLTASTNRLNHLVQHCSQYTTALQEFRAASPSVPNHHQIINRLLHRPDSGSTTNERVVIQRMGCQAPRRTASGSRRAPLRRSSSLGGAPCRSGTPFPVRNATRSGQSMLQRPAPVQDTYPKP